MAQRFVGIDLGMREVKACVINVGMRRVQVLDCAAAEVIPSEVEEGGTPDEVGDALRTAVELLREKGWNQYQAATTLPAGEASFRTLSFPFADPKRIAQAVGFEVEGQFPIPLEQLAYDHVVVPPHRKGQDGRALVVAVKGDMVERVTSAFREAGIDLRLVTVGAIANAQAVANAEIFSAARPEGEEGEVEEEEDGHEPALMIVDLGHNGSELVAWTENGPVAARSLRRGSGHVEVALRRAYKLEPEAARQAKEESAFLPHAGLGELSGDQQKTADVVHKALSPMLREIEHTRRWLETERGILVKEIRVTGGGSRLTGFEAWLSEQTELPVRTAVPDVRGTMFEAGTIDWAGMLAAFGAGFGAARRPLLQLRELDALGGGISFFEESFGTIFTIGAALLAFIGLDSVMAVKSVEQEVAAYEAELASASEEVFGEPMYNAEAVLEALEGVGGEDLMASVPARGSMEVLQVIHRAAKAGPSPAPLEPPTLPDGSVDPNAAAALAPVPEKAGIVVDDALQIKSIDIGPVKVKVSLTATRTTAQDRLAAKLEEIPCITRVQKGKIRDKANIKQFEMNIDHACYSGDIEKPSAEAAPEPKADEAEDKGSRKNDKKKPKKDDKAKKSAAAKKPAKDKKGGGR